MRGPIGMLGKGGRRHLLERGKEWRREEFIPKLLVEVWVDHDVTDLKEKPSALSSGQRRDPHIRGAGCEPAAATGEPRDLTPPTPATQ